MFPPRVCVWMCALESVWVGNKVAKTYSLQKSRWYSAAFALRQRMLNFVQNFEYYMMFEVIEPNWHLFQQNMDTVSWPSYIHSFFLYFKILLIMLSGKWI